MQTVSPNHQVETSRIGPLEPHLDTRTIIFHTNDRVPVEDLNAGTNSADQDGRQVAPGNLDGVGTCLGRDPPDDPSGPVDRSQPRHVGGRCPQGLQQTQPRDHLHGGATHIDRTARRALVARPLHQRGRNATPSQQHRQRGTGDTGTHDQHTSDGHQAQYRPASGR